MATFEATRPSVGAQAVGIARAAYEYALDYAKERKQFGRAIIENQAIAFKLADMKMQHRRRPAAGVARRLDGRNGQGVRRPARARMSKLYAGETAVWVTEQAIQILGGYGYIREYPVERWHRDAKIYTIFEGTSRDPAAGHRPGHLGHPHPVPAPTTSTSGGGHRHLGLVPSPTAGPRAPPRRCRSTLTR